MIWLGAFIASVLAFGVFTPCLSLGLEGATCTILGGYPLYCWGVIGFAVFSFLASVIKIYGGD